MQESIDRVKAAVEDLKVRHPNWDGIGAKEKTRLLAEETKRVTGTGVSPQTLYQPWIRELW